MTAGRSHAELTREARARVVIENVRPQVDAGRFPIKRVTGETLVVEADLIADGHELVAGSLMFRRRGTSRWRQTAFAARDNDRYRAAFELPELGRYQYTVVAWVDAFATWRRDLAARMAAGQDIRLALATGATLIAETAGRANRAAARALEQWAARVDGDAAPAARARAALDDTLDALMRGRPDPEAVRGYDRVLEVVVERPRARFSAWYEFFPRSCAPPGHATFGDCGDRLEHAAQMGFDIVYLPPIHPIGWTERKGPNNLPSRSPRDHGSPWAIGAGEGGHDAIHPALGTFDDFRAFVERARSLGLEVALDLAYQCSPDHPYVREHRSWFRERPDGSIQFAENPPKKYQDIYPLDFDTPDRRALWREMLRVVKFWIAQDVRIFRVDNPHTKPFRFWEWLIAEIRRNHPDTIFLSEAFTRPKVMHHLAKLGFSQSYTYFTWRTGKTELTEYFTELSRDESREYFRPNVWPNTPDILHEYLQHGGRNAFLIRALLATTLSANYGIYGPAFELCEHRPVREGSEEYLDSEKYQLRAWDVTRPDSIAGFIALMNRIRHGVPALQSDWSLRFHDIDNPMLLAYSKGDGSGALLVVANLDPHNVQSGWLALPAAQFALDPDEGIEAHDLLTDVRYHWRGSHHYIAIDPNSQPGHVLRLRRMGDATPAETFL